MRILVVEDDRKTGAFMAKALRAESVAVDVLRDGGEALATVGHTPFDALGLPEVHKELGPEILTVCFFGAMPLILLLGWWWIRHVLRLLGALTAAVEKIHAHNLRGPLPTGKFRTVHPEFSRADFLADNGGRMGRGMEAGEYSQSKPFGFRHSHCAIPFLPVKRTNGAGLEK